MDVLATPLVSNDQNVVTLRTILNKCEIPPRLYRSISPVLLETNEWGKGVDRGARTESPFGARRTKGDRDQPERTGLRAGLAGRERVGVGWNGWGRGRARSPPRPQTRPDVKCGETRRALRHPPPTPSPGGRLEGVGGKPRNSEEDGGG